MNQLKLFIELTRLKRPIGYMLLFWPCAWGLTMAYDFSNNYKLYFSYLLLFFLGSVLMRSAGCIINDMVDREFDRKVFRTKDRPIASGKVSLFIGTVYALVLCLIALLVLINFNNLTIILAISSLPLAFTYPLMKRLTYWPQLFLGVTFNYGLILGWVSVENQINLTPAILYFGAIFWTLGYDTVYGFQDIADDEIIGVKSTSIKFKKNPKNFLIMTYLIFIFSLALVGKIENYNYIFFIVLLFIIYQLFFQIYKFKKNNPILCLKVFKSNNFLGFLVYINILFNSSIS
jgi:4-hydroxybenzoate polyprenyltransferase